MKSPDRNKERSEKKLSLEEFLVCYNEGLPPSFPRAVVASLKEFKKAYPALFKGENTWSLDQHRKKFMDWRPQREITLS